MLLFAPAPPSMGPSILALPMSLNVSGPVPPVRFWKAVKELAARTGAKIYMGAQAGATFPHVHQSRQAERLKQAPGQ